MHSTFQAELRSTRRVLDLVRLHTNRQSTERSRAFNVPLSGRNATKLSICAPGTRQFASGNGKKPESALPIDSKPTKLASEIERWINHLSENGRPLDVWNTVSEQDDTGTWKLSAQARKDLEEVDKWTKKGSAHPTSPFGIKVADGRIRALSAQELRQEQEDGISSGVVHGPLLSSAASKTAPLSADPQGATGYTSDLETGTSRLVEDPSNGDDISELDGATSPVVPKFHGSAAARRQRAQRSRERTTAFALPSWFSSQNVVSRGSRQLAASEASPIGTAKAVSSTGMSEEAVSLHPNALSKLENVQAEKVRHRSHQDVQRDDLEFEATGGDQNPSASNPGPPEKSHDTSHSASTLIALDANAESYHIEEAQHNELLATAKGRLRPPASGSLDNRPGGIRGHLIIHFAAPDGEILLDHLVADMAKRLDCNLITFDAQDISSLIAKADVDSFVKDEAAMLGYEVYGEIYKNDADEQDPATSMTGEDAEDIEEDFSSPGQQGTPFMVGKPITIDLKALFSSKPHRRPSGFRQANIMPDMFGPSSGTKSGSPMFAGIVESILSSIKVKTRAESAEATLEDEQQSTSVSKESTIIHVKDLRSIQDTNIGKQFLMQLYEQVERRRANGELIMLVGTECSKDVRTTYDHTKINELQSSDHEEISSTIVITPVEQSGFGDLSADRARRIQIINARHLWQMLQSKNLSLNDLQPSSWKDRSLDSIHPADRSYLEKSLWSFGYVQRLASILASSDFAHSRHPIAEAAAVIELSDNSKYHWAKQTRKDTTTGHSRQSSFGKADQIAKIREKANKHEKRLLGGVIEPKKITTTFNDIHIPQDTVAALQTLTTLSLLRPDAFKYGVLASDRIPGLLLYGPPGTGKTLAAKAVARESGATMLEVSSADINDMYVGEGEKNVKALFSLAKKLSPCVVFLDEADAMFSARSAQGRRVSHRELLNQFLREWDGMSNDSGSAFIMVATNRPMDLDDAVLRRLPRRLLIDLPTESDRLEILKIHLRHEQLADDVNLSHLAAKTPFYSGSDLKNIAVSAALNAVGEENAQANADGNDDAPKYPDKRTLRARHFERALEEISASISEDMASLRDIKKFDEQYGDKRGKRKKSPKWGFKTAAEADAVLDTVKVRS